MACFVKEPWSRWRMPSDPVPWPVNANEDCCPSHCERCNQQAASHSLWPTEGPGQGCRQDSETVLLAGGNLLLEWMVPLANWNSGMKTMWAVFIWCTHLWEMSVMLRSLNTHSYVFSFRTLSSIPAPGSHRRESVLSRSSATQKWSLDEVAIYTLILLQILLVHDK